VNSIKAAAGFAAICAITACGGGGSDARPPTVGGSDTGPSGSGFTLGGTVSGLTGSGLTLTSNGQSLAVGANGSFIFPTPVASGSAYAVTIATQPESPAQECNVANGSGTLTSANVNNVAVTCGPLSPLSVTNSTPATGAREVARDNALIVSFSAALDPATVSTSTVVLSNSIAGRQEIDVAASGSQITITPRVKLLPATPYTVTIDTAVRGNRGRQMSAPATLNFTTREATWQTSAYIEDVTSPIRHPDVAANGNTVVAVWSEQGAGIGLNQYVQGTGWSGRKPFTSGDGSNNPKVAVDSRGTGHILWTRYQYPVTSVEGTQYSAASGFALTQLVEYDDVFGASAAQVAIDAQDQVFALWRYGSGSSSSDGSTWYSRYVTGAGWGDINPLDNAPSGARDARFALDPAGNAVVSWTQPDLSGRSRIFANRVFGGASAIAERIDNVAASINAVKSRVGIDAAGNAIVIYRYEVTAANDALAATRYVVGTGWTTPVTIDTSNTEIEEAEIAVDPAGNALAIWMEEGAPREIWGNRYTVGAGWGTAQRLAVATENTEGLKIAMDKGGNAIAAWMQYEPNVADSTEIMALRYVAGAGWGTALSIDNETDDVIDPHLAFDASGNAVVIWLSYDGSVNNVRANRFE
jgi:hypothetical protein